MPASESLKKAFNDLLTTDQVSITSLLIVTKALDQMLDTLEAMGEKGVYAAGIRVIHKNAAQILVRKRAIEEAAKADPNQP